MLLFVQMGKTLYDIYVYGSVYLYVQQQSQQQKTTSEWGDFTAASG